MPRGAKTCGGCGKSVGPRTRVCECGFDFFATAKPAVAAKPAAPTTAVAAPPKEEEQPEEQAPGRYDLSVILIPGTGVGDKSLLPLVPVKCNSLEDIPNWMKQCQDWAEKRNQTFAASAFRYMARQIWKDDELEKALAIIKEVPVDHQN